MRRIERDGLREGKEWEDVNGYITFDNRGIFIEG